MTTLKLSEAMRLGAMLRPQGYGRIGDRTDETWCAFQAAYGAKGKRYDGQAFREWPWLLNSGTCPDCGAVTATIGVVVAHHLNDTHRWTRERIAEWVATVEPQDTALPVREPTAFDAVPTAAPDAVTHG